MSLHTTGDDDIPVVAAVAVVDAADLPLAAAVVAADPPPLAGGGFSFGGAPPSAPGALAGGGGFSFVFGGASGGAPDPPAGGFNFGGSTTGGPAGGFSFGGAAPAPPPPAGGGGFSFGSTPAPTPAPAAGGGGGAPSFNFGGGMTTEDTTLSPQEVTLNQNQTPSSNQDQFGGEEEEDAELQRAILQSLGKQQKHSNNQNRGAPATGGFTLGGTGLPGTPATPAPVNTPKPPLAVTVAADPPQYEAIPELLFVDMQQQDEEKVAAAVTKLADLLNTSNANWTVNADQAFSLGVIAIILLLTRKWHYIRSIQKYVWYVLARLTLSNGNKDAQARATAAAVSIIESGGIEAIMASMKSFRDDDEIQGNGCAAIGNVFRHFEKTIESTEPLRGKYAVLFTTSTRVVGNPTIDKAMDRFVYKLNGIELVVSVMKKFQNNASVQHCGLHVLQQLSNKPVLRDALKKGGALSAVGEATEKHDGNDLQSAATAFFNNMFGNN